MARCRDCPLSNRTRVWGEGPEKPAVCLLGEAPGSDEDDSGRPFSGPSGSLLSKAFHNLGLLRHQVWVTNVIGCRPPANDLEGPEGQLALECCRAGFLAELAWLKEAGLKVIQPLGNHAMEALGLPRGVAKLRGSVFPLDGLVAVPTYHPSFLLRGMWKEESTWLSDLEKAALIGQDGWKKPAEKFTLRPSLEQWEAFVEQALKKDSLLGVDIETTGGLKPELAEILVVGFAVSGEKAISFPFYSQGMVPYWSNRDAGRARAALRKLLEGCPLMFQNALFDTAHLAYHGFPVSRVEHDVMLAHHAIHPELPHDLGYIVSVYGRTPYWKATLLDAKVPAHQIDDESLRTYNLRDAVVLHQVLPGLLSDLAEVGTMDVYRNISLGLLKPVAELCSTGLLLEKGRLSRWRKKLVRELEQTEQQMRLELQLPPAFSFNSGDHLKYLVYSEEALQFKRARAEQEVYDANPKRRRDTKKFAQLQEQLQVLEKTRPLELPTGYTYRKKTEGGSTAIDEDVLLRLKTACLGRLGRIGHLVRPTADHVHERADLQRTVRFLDRYFLWSGTEKLLSTYTRFPFGKDNRVRSQYLIHGTRTGRLASRNPNMQNIPKDARALFVAGEGCLLLQADYSNLELRVLAFESEDAVMQAVFEKGGNIHDQNTVDLFGLDKTDPLWPAARKAAKIYIFGRNYGGGLEGIHARVQKEVSELPLLFSQFKEKDQAYRKAHPAYDRWCQAVKEQVSSTRQLTNAFGRIRVFLGTEAEIIREGLNFPIQSAAADIINQATIRFCQAKQKTWKLVGQIHDALLVEVPAGQLKPAAELLRESMEKPLLYRGRQAVFPVELSAGPDWAKQRPL
jgi:uracil-DNA glycosylase family 4